MIDFDSNRRDSYLDGMWSRTGFRSSVKTSLAEDTVVAHGMVQSFVNAFARDGEYIVTFDPSVDTAGTDFRARKVSITPSPVADRSLSAQEAGQVLTGLATHEICHPRYGRMTAQAVEKRFPGNRVADRLSNLLDDVRIERRFVADYPGYEGIFDPTLAYIGAAQVKRNDGQPFPVSLRDQVNVAIAAIRYPTFAAWDEATSADALWWVDWSERGAREDSPKRHAEFIAEALAHIVNVRAANPESKTQDAPAPRPQPRDPEKSEDEQGMGPQTNPSLDELDDADEQDDDAQATESTPAPAGDDEPADESIEAPGGPGDEMTDGQLNAETTNDQSDGPPLPDCSGSAAVDSAALEGDTTHREIRDLKSLAQEIVSEAAHCEDDGHGRKVNVCQSLKGLTGGGDRKGPSSIASRYIRNAILKSRTGHGETSAFKSRGRLDQHALTRTAFSDYRLFEKKTAPSPGRYLVWVMVDCSSSMKYELPRAAQVAHAMATATAGTPSVRMTVWGWSFSFRHAEYSRAGVARVWSSGEDPEEIFRMSGLRLGGTPDATITSWAGRAVKKAARGDEQPVLIVISDGEGELNMDERVEEVRKLGVEVYSVSFGADFTAEMQLKRFGHGNFVPYAGSVAKTAKPLADLFVRITGRRR